MLMPHVNPGGKLLALLALLVLLGVERKSASVGSAHLCIVGRAIRARYAHGLAAIYPWVPKKVSAAPEHPQINEPASNLEYGSI